VPVVATLKDRSLERTAMTNENGEYVLDFLPVGVYRISASFTGFTSQVQDDIRLGLDQRLRVDFTLQVGSVNEQVIVTSEAPLVNSDSSNVGEVIEQARVLELPTKGRQFVELVTLTAGATPEVQGGFGGQFSLAGFSVNVNGNRSDSNNFLLDGIPINDSMWGRMAASPSVDAIQELKVQSFLYSAEFGGAGGGQINLTMRSGQNAFHGTGFGFFRRDVFDARNFFAITKPPLSQNDYGAGVGGPIVRSKLFFFVNGERLTTLSGFTLISTLPTAAMRSGNLTGLAQAVNPVTKQPYPGNQIPIIDPISSAVLALIPLSNLPGILNNYNTVEDEHARSTQFNGKIDYQLSRADFLSAHANVSDLLSTVPAAGSPPGFTPVVTLQTHTLGMQWARVISPSIINQVRFGYTYSESNEPSAHPTLDFASQVGILGTSHAPLVLGVPRFSVTGFSVIGDLVSTLDGKASDYHFIDDFSRTFGGHSLKTGITVSRLEPQPFFYPSPRGTFNYLGNYTGNPFADFLLGLPSTGSVGVGDPTVNGRAWRISPYVQDDWRVTSHLTLNLGLRYELLTPATETSNRISNLDTNTGNILLPCDGGQPSSKANLALFPTFHFVCNAPAGVGKGLTKTDFYDWGPRLGFAYSTANNRWVARGGYGIFYSFPPMAVRIGTPSFSIPFFRQTTATNSATSPVNTANLFTVPGVNAFAGQPFSTDYRAGRVHQWNIDLQHQFGTSTLLEIAYLGSRGTDLDSEILPNQAIPGPGTVASRTPFPLLANSLIKSGPFAISRFNAMQVRFEQRLWKGFELVAHYTFSKSLDDASNLLSNSAGGSVPQNSRSIISDYSRSTFDARHRFVADGLYKLPFSSSNGAMNRVIGGWQISFVLTLQSNTPFSPVLSTDRSGTNAFFDRPDQIGNPNAISNRTSQQWFNTAAFQLQAPGTFGNTGRDTINGPNYKDVDLAILKKVAITEQHQLEFRVEAFNSTNRVNFNLPNRTFATPQFGTITSAQDARVMQFGVKYIF
jgi:hypothetical protein